MPFITQGKTNWKFLLIVIILAIMVGVGALWYARRPVQQYQQYQPVEIKKTEKIVKQEEAVKNEVLNWQTYSNKDYGFEIEYPEDLKGSEIVMIKEVGGDCENANFPKECPNITYNWDKKGEIKFASNEASKITINNIPFCFYKTSTEAMTTNTVYKLYLYVTIKDNKCFFVQLPFSESWKECDMAVCLGETGQAECQGRCNQSRQKIEINKKIRDQIITTFNFNDVKIYNHAGSIEKMYQKDGKEYLDIDFFKFILFTDPKIIYGENDEKGDCTPGPDGYCIVDNDKTIKSYEVAEDVEIMTIGYGTIIPFEYLEEFLVGHGYGGNLWTLQITDNIIKKMWQIYTP